MVSNSHSKNLTFFIISTLLILLSFVSNNTIITEFDKNINENEGINISDQKSDGPPDDEGLREEIEAARKQKDNAEIECQQKKIYVIALGVLSGILLLLLIIYSLFKCYIFCLSRKERSTPFRRIRISKLGQVYLEENFDLNKSEVNENNNNFNSNNVNDKNDAPTCFSVLDMMVP